MVKILQHQYTENVVIQIFIYTGTFSRQFYGREGHWKVSLKEHISSGQTQDWWKKNWLILGTAFRNTSGYPNWIINQVTKQIKVNLRDPVPNIGISNNNEATQTNKQTIVEEHNNKKHLMIPYEGGKTKQVITSEKL